MKRMAPDGELVNLLATADVTSRRQTLDPVYVLNGAIYLADRNVLLDRGSFYADKTYAYLMPPERSLKRAGPASGPCVVASTAARRGNPVKPVFAASARMIAVDTCIR